MPGADACSASFVVSLLSRQTIDDARPSSGCQSIRRYGRYLCLIVGAIKAGAVEFLTKPFRDDLLLSSVREALDRSRVAILHEAELRKLRERYALLTTRERQVMTLVVSGLLNKQVGGELGISEITVKAHRGQVMQKMNANSLPDLVKMAARLKVAA